MVGTKKVQLEDWDLTKGSIVERERESEVVVIVEEGWVIFKSETKILDLSD
jgi:hypothetical protein